MRKNKTLRLIFNGGLLAVMAVLGVTAYQVSNKKEHIQEVLPLESEKEEQTVTDDGKVPGAADSLAETGTSLVEAKMEENAKKQIEVRDYLISRIEKEIPYVKVNGHREKRLPNNVNVCFRFIEGESLLIMLDQKGICASSGSACTSGSLDPSHVLLAIGLPHEIAHGSLRLTLSEETTKEDADYVVDNLKMIVERLRSMSPLYDDFVKKESEGK